MLPGPTPRPSPEGHTPRARSGAPGRLVSVLVAVGLVAGLPGLVGAAPASAAAPAFAPTLAAATTAPGPVSLSVVAGPTRGGTTVDLSGSGVGATTRVLFGTTAVTRVTRVSSTRVRVVTPAHPAGLASVRVTTPAGTSPVSSRTTFAFEAVPTVSALSSRTSTTRGGTVVTITGTGLLRASAVRFGTAAGTGLTHLSATQVRVSAPAHAAGTVDVRVTTPGGTSAVTAADRFTYTSAPVAPAPTVTGLSVTAGPTRGGTIVDVSGTGFTGATAATFGGTAARLTVLSSTRVRVVSPARPAGVVQVQVRTPGGTSRTSAASAYAYDAVPTLTGLSPTSGPTAGGGTVTLTGTGLTRATSVQFGSTTSTRVVVVSATTLRVTSPARPVGTVDVRVTTPGGSSATTTRARYTYQAPPAVTALSATAGPLRGGTTVTVTGLRLTGATRVSFGGTAAPFTVLSPTTIRATSPAHAAGLVGVTVTTPYGTSPAATAATFAYDAVPVVTSVSPQTGPPAGGTVVTITGTGLTRAGAVRFGTTPATNLVRVSDTTVRVTTPAHASGPVDVQLTSPGGTSATGIGARYTYGWPPVVTSLSVDAGPLKGGTVVTISGTHLGDATSVQFGSAAGTGLVRISDTSLRVTSPAHVEGAVAVRVVNVNGTSPVTPARVFTYVGVPAVSALSTPAGPLKGGVVVVLTGTRLGLASRVDFGGVPGTALVRLSDTRLQVTAPARPVGPVDVRVTTPGGQSPVVAAARFTYQALPTVSSVSPALAPTKGGTVVTLTGAAYDRVSSVTFGGVAATSVTRLSATQLRVTLPAHAEGDVDVRVTTPGGTAVVAPGARFSYQNPPVVSSVTPAAGPLGVSTVVTLSGTSFTDVGAVQFGDVAATSWTRVSATSLTAVVPARTATGLVPVRVTTRAGTVLRADGFTYVAGATLGTGQTLSAGTALRSPSGAYVATMQADGNLVITTSGGTRRWTSATSGPGNRLQVRADGNVVMLRTNGTVAWSSGTNGWTGASLTLTDAGLLQARQGTTAVWDHRGVRYDRMLPGQVLRPGESIMATNGAWSLLMRTDGNLVLNSSKGVRRWAAFTAGSGNTASMQTDGNFVVRNSRGVTQWSTKTSGAGSVIRVLGTANVAVYRGSTVTWAITGGPAPAAWKCYSRATQDCIQRFGYYGQRAWNYPVDPWGNNCTNFSAYRLSRDGVKNPGNLGNATNWDTNARAKGFAVDQRPRVGDIAQWNSNHVAYVDWVSSDGNTVAISESGYGGTVLGATYTSMSGRRIIERGSYSWPSNFIHFR
ncbi:IPT/TIG domain-containing protein [Terrabacter sp. C0L_2]|uniref:IPT/TIG domain-containing protein n=1 Tax=Terrabacter sp. C0L_2 TaxID=3108389 RepID=UPI002ED1E982|nr:IPT/TIG domain-containing protein [Terrabacter sp. C0L_2]